MLMDGGMAICSLNRYNIYLFTAQADANYFKVEEVIPIFEKLYPNCVAEFFFDQSSAHGAFASDALNAKEMNVSPGGKQRKMHATRIPNDNPNPALRGREQQMNFPKIEDPNHPFAKFSEQPKGMRVILEERGLWNILVAENGGKAPKGDCSQCKLSQKARDAQTRNAVAQTLFDGEEDEDRPPAEILAASESHWCCMRKVLSLQSNFLAEIPRLQEVIERAGHKCYFLPKFHCELNPIEMFWGWVKIREHISN